MYLFKIHAAELEVESELKLKSLMTARPMSEYIFCLSVDLLESVLF